MSVLESLVQAQRERRQRLFHSPAPPPLPAPPRPLSPFCPYRLQEGFIGPPTPTIVVRSIPEARWHIIAREVAGKYGVDLHELLSPSRRKPVAGARFEAFYRISKETALSLPQIGKKFSNRNHTTVLHGVVTHARRIGDLETVERRKGRRPGRGSRVAQSEAAAA